MFTQDEFAKEIMRQAQRVISDEYTKRLHPSYITKPQGREHLHRLRGAAEMMFMLFGGYPDDAVRDKLAEAYAAAAKWL